MARTLLSRARMLNAFLGLVLVGGEVREWVEATRDVGFGDTSDGEWMQRARIHLDGQWDPIRIYIEPISGLELGRDLARASDKDDLDLHTAFVEIKAGTSYLRAGRQELGFGSGRILDTRDGPNIRASYDGARAHTALDKISLDAFIAREVAIRPGILDDTSTDARAIWGTWASYVAGGITIDAYALGTHHEAAYQRISGDEVRHTFGARFRVSHGTYAAEVETAVQRGEISGTPIDAWLLGGELVADWFTAGGGITSGDTGHGALGTFSPLSFRAAYFGYLAANGASNEIGAHVAAKHELGHLTLRGEVWEFWRQNTADAIYGLTGAVIAPPGDRFIGTQLESVALWKITGHVTIGAVIAEFVAHRMNDITYVASWVTYAF
ncbi:MAG: alginate export family protein [Kofleriaceae bacterium]